jgi:chromosome segregation ATPase
VGDQIEQTLQAGALDPAIGEVVTSGRLERPDVAVGFPGVAPSGGGKESTSRPRKDDKADSARKDMEQRLRREQDKLAEATERREAAEADHEEAQRNAEAAAKAMEKARRKLDAETEREGEAAAKVERLRGELA